MKTLAEAIKESLSGKAYILDINVGITDSRKLTNNFSELLELSGFDIVNFKKYDDLLVWELEEGSLTIYLKQNQQILFVQLQLKQNQQEVHFQEI